MKKLLLILFVLISIRTYAQDKNALGFTFNYGPKVFSTYNTPLYGHYTDFGFEYKISTDPNSDWARELNVKSVNINTSYSMMDNVWVNGYDNTIGNDITLTSSLDIDIFTLGYTRFVFSPEAGFLYSTKDFYNTDNHDMIMGSKLNLLIGGRLKFLLPLDEDVNLQIGGGFDHSSNSRIVLPNDGLNRVSFFFGATTNMGLPKVHNTQYTEVKTNSFVADLIVGYTGQVKTGYFINKKTGKGMYPDTVAVQGKTPSIEKFGLSLGYTRHLNEVFGLNVSGDFIYTPTTLNYDKFFMTYLGDYTSYHPLSFGGSVGVEMLLGKVAFTGNYGYLIFGTPVSTKRLYGDIGAKYYFSPNFGVEFKSYPSNFGSVGFCFKL